LYYNHVNLDKNDNFSKTFWLCNRQGYGIIQIKNRITCGEKWKGRERKRMQESWPINAAYVWVQPMSTYLVSCIKNCLVNCVIYHEYLAKTTHTHWQLVMMLKCKTHVPRSLCKQYLKPKKLTKNIICKGFFKCLWHTQTIFQLL
jgi:hypothetical protein